MPYWRLFYHLVWATYRRHPFIVPEVEDFLYKILIAKCNEKGSQVLAINGMPDHVHLVASIPPKISVSDFVKFAKGASSYVMQAKHDLPFKWQRGYGSFTLSERNLGTAIDYVRRQKEHHAQGTIIARLERESQEDEGPRFAPDEF